MNFEIKNKHFVVVGLGKTGIAITRFLAQHEGKVTVSETSPLEKLKDRIRALKNINFTIETGGHQKETFLSADYIVVSPGIPLNLAVLNIARNKGIPIIGELDLVYPYLNAPIIAITGTNGKTTTVTLLGKILKANGKNVWVGGNIGEPLINAIEQKNLDYIVAEISSFQLESSSNFHPWIAACLNVSEDHIDRHRDFHNYLHCKLKLFQHQKINDWSILEGDNKKLIDGVKRLNTKSQKLLFGLKKTYLPGAYLREENIIAELYEKWSLSIKDTRLLGRHNYKNIMATLLIAQITQCDFQVTKEIIFSFPGLAHRLEWVRSLNGVSFYNDSKATNVEATLCAIDSLGAPIVLIAGGLGKGQDFTPLGKRGTNKVKAVVVIGSAKREIAQSFKEVIPVVETKTLEEAVKQAWELAKPKGNVLLSPACASFDMFKDFKERGRVFKRAVYEL